MTKIILCAVHPVAFILTKVGDVFGLLAFAAGFTVVQDNADSAFGNSTSKLGLAKAVCDGLSLSSTRPLTAQGGTVSVPSIDIRAAPTEVVGQLVLEPS